MENQTKEGEENMNFLDMGKDSIYSEGYGIVAKKVMRDKELSTDAKAIYAYICSFAGSGSTAFPGAELMMAELKLSEKTFYKKRKELIDNGYITIIKQRKGNRRDNNIYNLVQNKKFEHSKKVSIEKPSKNAVFEHGNSESVQPESVQTESVQNSSTNINSLNNNSLNNNSINKSILPETISASDVIELFNNICLTLPKVKTLQGNRKKSLQLRLKENNDIQFWEDIFKRVNASDFLSGRNEKWMNCSFDWIIKPANLTKISEGNYDNERTKAVKKVGDNVNDNRSVGKNNEQNKFSGFKPAEPKNTLTDEERAAIEAELI